MSEAGRRRWWRLAAVAMLGSGTVIGGWTVLSRRATADPSEPVVAQQPPAEGWQQPVAPSSPPPPVEKVVPAVATLPAVPVASAPAVPPPAELPALPTIPTLPDMKPSQPPVLPAVPMVDTTPAVPPIPPVEPAKLTVPPVAPVLPPPSVVPSIPLPSETTPPPSPAKSSELVQPEAPPKPNSDLQGGNTGNTVRTENPGGSSGPAAPVTPVAPLPPLPDLTKPALPQLPPVEPPGTLVDRVKPVEPLQNSEKNVLPIPNLVAPTPGDPAVMKLNQSVAAAVLGGVLLAQTTPTAAAPPVPLPTHVLQNDPKTLEEVNNRLKEIQKDLKQLTELLNGKKDKDGYPLTSDPGLVAEMKALKDKLGDIEKDLAKLKTQSSSLRPATPIVDPKAAKGIVRIVNEYPVQVSIVVNGTSYRVAPTKTLDVEVPVGDFTYQLLESGAAATKSTIKEKETVTLRIK
jgi:hypothetical protein